MRTKNFPEKQNKRRMKAAIRLGKQIDSGVKNTKEGVVTMSEEDIKRAKKELFILNSRLNSSARDKRTKKHR